MEVPHDSRHESGIACFIALAVCSYLFYNVFFSYIAFWVLFAT